MDTIRDSPPEEVLRLRRCLNDMVSVMALPTLWTAGDAQQIVSTLGDALLGMLGLAFVLVRLNDTDGGSPIDVIRLSEVLKSNPQFQMHGTMWDAAFGDSFLKTSTGAPVAMGGADFSVAWARLGIDGEIGVVIAGSERPEFPEQTERLLLDVAANQAVLGLQQSRLLSEQKRVARELEEHVAQRTRELAAANAELEKRERDSRMIVDNMPGLVALLNAAGEIDLINRQLSEYSGQTVEELSQWTTNDTVHPEDLPGVIESFSRSITTGEPFNMAQRIKRSDGVYRWFQNRGFPVREADGNVVRWCVLLTDIDAQKRAEEALRESERELRSIVDTIPGMISVLSPTFDVERVNQPFLDYFGLRAEDINPWRTRQDQFHPEDHQRVIQIIARSMASGEPYDLVARGRGATGDYRWIQFKGVPFRDRQGQIVRWYCLNIDIDKRMRAEEELRRSEAFLSKAQRLSGTGSFSWRLDTNEIVFSEEAYRIFEFDRVTPVTFERIGSRVHPEDVPLLAERTEAARRSGEGHDYEIRIVMPDGSMKYLHTTSSETRDATGRREYIGAIQDVTQRRLAEEALNKARSELAHVSRVTTLGALTASMAHEINQPLSGIITNASTCLRFLNADSPNIDGARETARRTIRDGNRASDVIARLRALFGKREFTLEPTDLNEAAREIVALTLNDLQRNRVTVQFELSEGLPLVNGDRVQLQQVILNLVRNASEAMADVQDRPRHLLIRTEGDQGGTVRLSVRDTGVGFGDQNLDNLFNSFYTTKTGGMGIGLSVSRSIIERHQGRLWAESNEGAGATFSFSIPAETITASSSLATTSS